MIEALFLLFSFLKSGLKNQTELALENLALRQQLAILERNRPYPRLRRRDRLFWTCLSSVWQRWRESLIVVKSESVVRWHRRGFALYWAHLSKHHGAGRPETGNKIRDLIRKKSTAYTPRFFSLAPAIPSLRSIISDHPKQDANQ
jgi:hypothetical protein